MNDTQIQECRRLKQYLPFRIVYGAISQDGTFETNAVTTMRTPNALARKGWQVWVINL